MDEDTKQDAKALNFTHTSYNANPTEIKSGPPGIEKFEFYVEYRDQDTIHRFQFEDDPEKLSKEYSNTDTKYRKIVVMLTVADKDGGGVAPCFEIGGVLE